MSYVWLLPVGQFFAEALSSIFLEQNILAKFREYQIKKSFHEKVYEALEESVTGNPNASHIFENFDAKGYLENPLVKRELSSIFDVENRKELNLEVLTSEWSKHLGNQLLTDQELIVKKFISNLKEKLWGIPDFQTLLHIKEQREMHDFMSDIARGVQQLLSASPTLLAAPVNDVASQDQPYQVQLAPIKALINSGYPNAALTQITKLEFEVQSKNISNVLRAKINTLIGICFINLEENEKAVERFIRANQLDPENPETMTNLAIVSLVQNKPEEAVAISEKVLNLQPRGTTAKAVWFDALARIRKYENLSEIVEEKFLDDKEYARVVGLSFAFGGDLEGAEKYLRLSWAQSPADYYTGLMLIRVLMRKGLPVLGSFGSEFENNAALRDVTKEPLEIINNVLEAVNTGDNRTHKLNALATRAGLLIAKGDIAQAKQDCDRVLGDDDENLLALNNRAIVALYENDFAIALSLFKKLPKDYLHEENLHLAYARAFIGVEDYDAALELLNASTWLNRKDYIESTVMKVWALLKKKENQKAQELREELLNSASEEDYYCIEAVGHIDMMMTKADDGLLNFEKAYSLASNSVSKQRIALQIAHVYYNKQEFKNAVYWIELTEVDFVLEPTLAKMYVSALYSLGEYEKSISIAKTLREGGVHDSFLYEIEIWIMEYLGDLSSALALSKEIVQRDPTQLHHKFQVARLEFRLGNKDKAYLLISSLSFTDLNPTEIMQIAEMYQLMGYPNESIKAAYIAYRKGKNSPDIHRVYLSIFMRLEKELILEHSLVAENTAVLLINEQGERWVKILSLVTPDELKEEYSLTSTQAKLLLGNTVGAVIHYKDSPIEKLSFQIKEIQSLYVRTFQEIFSDYGFRFPEDNHLQKMNIADNDFSNFMMSIASMSLRTDRILGFYRNGGITVEQLSIVTGKNQLLLFQSLQLTQSEKIIASRGTAQEQHQFGVAINSTVDTTLTLSALATLNLLGGLHFLHERFKKLYIHQSIVDQLDITLYELSASEGSERSIVGYHNGAFYMNETSADEISNNILSIQAIRDFVMKNCEIISIRPELAQYMLNPTSGNLAPVGNISNSSILVAKQTGSSLYSDEWILSHSARVNYGVPSFWSQTFFDNLLSNKIILDEEYNDFICRLLEAEYYFVSVNSSLIYEVLIREGFRSSGKVEMLLQTLRGPDATEINSLKIASEVIKKLWLSLATSGQRVLVLDRILHNLSHARMMSRVLIRLQVLLEREFLVAPLHLDDVNREILNWWRINHGPDEIFWAPKL